MDVYLVSDDKLKDTSHHASENNDMYSTEEKNGLYKVQAPCPVEEDGITIHLDYDGGISQYYSMDTPS